MGAHPSGRLYVRAYLGVRRANDHALLEQAIEGAGARIVYSSAPSVAPLFVTLEHPEGGREGVVIYAFHANRRVTRNRPKGVLRFVITDPGPAGGEKGYCRGCAEQMLGLAEAQLAALRVLLDSYSCALDPAEPR